MIPLILFLVIAAVTASFWKMAQSYHFTRNMKGPMALPVLGNTLQFLGDTEDFMRIGLNFLKTYGSPMRFWFLTKLLVLTDNPEDHEIILNNPNLLAKHEVYQFLRPALGDGIATTADTEKWRANRKFIAHTFNFKILQGFIPIFQERSLVFCDVIKNMAGKGNFDVFPWMARLALDSVCETAMGVKIGAQTTNCEFLHWLNSIASILIKRMYRPLYYFNFTFGLMKERKELDALTAKLRNFTEQVITVKQEELKQHKQKSYNSSVDKESSGRPKVFLDLMLEMSEAGRHFTKEEFRDEVQTIISGGSDTTAGTTSYALMMLGMHPEIQEKVVEEQQDIFGNNNRAITSEDLAQMKYLEMVLKETMRMFPLIPLVARVAKQDVKLQNCTIPQGSGCFVAIYATHMNPKYWTNPYTFDPDRFLNEEIAKRHPYSWIPFSAGPRNCIGMKYAMMSMKTILSIILRRYKVSCDYKKVEDIRLKFDLILKPVEGHIISLEIRK